ncbi:MAG: carbonic anhydrase [Fibrobacterota bacterium]
MANLIAVDKSGDVLPQYQKTPVSDLLEFHNLGREFEPFDKARLLIGMCIDNRKQLRLPGNFAFIIRTGGANLRYSEFKISYCIAIGGVKCVVLIAHSLCGMVNVFSQKDLFVNGLVEHAGWSHEQATDHFMSYAPMFQIGNEIDFILSETRRLCSRYPNILIAPLFYRTEENRLYQIAE